MGLKCTNPIQIKSPDGLLRLVGCGHCLNCTRKRQLSWALRIYLEAQCYEYSSFLTLTYDEATRPERLDYEHISQFLRALRKSLKRPIRYFCVGEYGKLSGREHWHLILFNSPFLVKGVLPIKQWKHGGVHFGECTPQSAAYTARYSLKTGVKGGDYIVNMSRRPGIGLDRIRQIGSWLAKGNPVLESPPSWWRLGGRLYPLDKTARDVLISSYEGNGGKFKHGKMSALRADMEARISILAGEFRPNDAESLRVQRFEREELTHGAI